LPIIIFAGINGSGKTTLLECLCGKNIEMKIETTQKQIGFGNYKDANGFLDVNLVPYKSYTFDKIKEKFDYHEYKDNVIYLKAGIDDISVIEDEFRKSWYNFLREHDYRPSEIGDEFNRYIKNIFENLDLTFRYSHLDKDDNVIFKNDNNDEFKIEELSTGEKTLLSKILFLFFQDYKNKIILIDEPELSLHPSWQSSIFKVYENFAKENNCQVILATHSPHIIANTPHKYLRLLVEEEGKIVAKTLDGTPLDRDLNTIIKTVMGADYIPQWLEEKLFAYREFCEKGQEDSEEAQKLKSEILEYESPNSSFFQGLAFDMELMR